MIKCDLDFFVGDAEQAGGREHSSELAINYTSTTP